MTNEEHPEKRQEKPEEPQGETPVAEPHAEEVSSDDRTMALLCHVGGILTGFIVPLIIWVIKKDQSKFVDDHGKEALNFQLTLLIAYFVGGATACFIVGFFIIMAAAVVAIIFGVMAAVAASRGERYRYPLTIRFIK